MLFKRASGVLLHPTSLPGPFGIGDIGPIALRWIDFLSEARSKYWQILPLGPTGYGDSPYQAFSSFAGNFYIVSPEALLSENLLQAEDLVERPSFPLNQVDYGTLIYWKLALLDRAYSRFQTQATPALKTALSDFTAQQAGWLDDFALFMALKEAHGGAPWHTWEAPLRDRQPKALAEARELYAEAIQRQIFRQFIFFRQWSAVRAHAKVLGIEIIGDIPIFVAHDSADVWAHPELFYLDKQGQPTIVAGVPPDYFSPTGQLWGNPLYRWDVHAASGYSWWISRFRAMLDLVDIVRLDHFRGFAGYFEVPGDAKTAELGRWVPGPGKAFFEAVQDALNGLPIIAEDLGVITPDVVELRDHFDLPGMKVLQFAFDSGPENEFLPHNYTQNVVVYTGTHDNDTARGWYERISDNRRDFFRRYMARSGEDAAWDMIRSAWHSVAVLAVAPMQDLLNLGNQARMNYPGNPSGNWTWRMTEDDLNDFVIKRLAEMNHLYQRRLPLPGEVVEEEPPEYLIAKGYFL